MSPFELFRRNSKWLMAFLILLAMFAFVVLPSLTTYMQRGGMGGDSVAATYDGIEVTRSSLQRTTQQHVSVVRFLQQLAEETIRRGGMPQTPGFQYDEQSGQIQSLGIDSRPDESATVDTMRLAAEAQKAGFELDDIAVRTWLIQFTDQKLSDGEIAAILARSTNNTMAQFHLNQQLRLHLLADLYRRTALVGLVSDNAMMPMPVVTPLAQWENFLQLNRNATVDAYGVLVADYVDQTDAEPAEAEIAAMYAEGKERVVDPSGLRPEPGFAQPDQAKFEYLAADLDAFIERQKSKLTEEQLRAEYERRKAGGDFAMPESESQLIPASEPVEPQTPPNDDPPSDDPPSDDPSPEASIPGPGEDESSPEASAPQSAELESEPAEPLQSVDEVPATEDSGYSPRRGARQLVNFFQEVTEVPQSEPAGSTPEAEEAQQATENLELGDEPEAKVPTFDDVRDEIATDLARPAAFDTLDKEVTDAFNMMQRYFSRVTVHRSNVSVGVATDKDAPARPDLRAYAAEHGLQYGTTDLVSRATVEDTEPGQSFGLGENMNRRGSPFSILMFGFRGSQGELPAKPELSPLRTVDLNTAKTFITWKTEEKPAYTPELAEVRDEVIAAVRRVAARDLARRAAEDLVAKAAQAESLADVVPKGKTDNLFTGVGPFTALQFVPGQGVSIGNVPELDAVGEDFMDAVYATEVGQTAMAPNDPQSVFYVVRPTAFDPPIDELRERFTQPQGRFIATMIGNSSAAKLQSGFYDSMQKRTGYVNYLQQE